MATAALTIKTQTATREKLASFLPSHELVKMMENLTSDVSLTIPELVALAQAAADAALAAAEALQAIGYVEAAVDPETPNARALAVTPRLSLNDAGPGAAMTVDLNLAHQNAWSKNQSTTTAPLTDALIVVVDATASNCFKLLLTAALPTRSLAKPTGMTKGMQLAFIFQQPAAGGPCAITFDPSFDFGPAGTPTASTGANALDLLTGWYDDVTDKIVATFRSAGGSGPAASSSPVLNARLYLQTGVPVPTADVIGASTLYWGPFRGNGVTLWDGSKWTNYALTEQSLALSGLIGNAMYDAFGFQNAGVPNFEILEWKSQVFTILATTPGTVGATAHGAVRGTMVSFTSTGLLPSGVTAGTAYYVVSAGLTANQFEFATTIDGTAITFGTGNTGVLSVHISNQRATDISLQDGRYCKVGDKTRLYLGSFLATSSTTTQFSRGLAGTTNVGGRMLLWNYYNRVRMAAYVIDTAAGWSYNGTVFRQADGVFGNRVDMVVGVSEDIIEAQVTGTCILTGTSSVGAIAVGLDTVLTANRITNRLYSAGTSLTMMSVTGTFEELLAPGMHSITWLERGCISTTCNFRGSQDGSQDGMQVQAWV